ncbi:type I restriction enzyme, S subunit [Algibacter lectus]|uniref:restriction endonuclease subunit S n=1 Tax=Algibacter lectus TaxID=221126 RepID=UPI0008E1DE78|nr:restriction endonuclease subunit S [Algibacter lectus]SFB97544.1 type I restriction enzyme, S subunit [Algibacter lectus]
MRLNYKRLGDYIQVVNIRNKNLEVETLLGVSIKKVLMPSIANTVGTDMSRYKIIEKNQFAYGPVTSRNGDKISIALLEEYDKALVSQAYTVFEIIDETLLNAEYLMMWFRRPEFDRYARFKSHGSARETFDWEELEETELPIPSIEKQREIVKEYNTIVNRIKLNETLNQKLEDTAQALYKHWFVDFNFPITKESYPELVSKSPELLGKHYKSSGGEMVYNEELDMEIPLGWKVNQISNLLSKIIDNRGKTPPLSHSEEKLLFETYFLENKSFPKLHISEKTKYVSQEIFNNWFRKGHPERYDVLVGTVGNGIPNYTMVPDKVDFCIGQNIVGFRFNDTISPYYFRLFLETFLFREQFNGRVKDTAQPSIRVADYVTIILPIGDKCIMGDFLTIVTPLFNLMESISSQYMPLTGLKNIILSKMSKVETKKSLV